MDGSEFGLSSERQRRIFAQGRRKDKAPASGSDTGALMSRALLPFDELEQLFVKGGDLRAVDAIVGVKHAIDEIQVV